MTFSGKPARPAGCAQGGGRGHARVGAAGRPGALHPAAERPGAAATAAPRTPLNLRDGLGPSRGAGDGGMRKREGDGSG